MKMLILALLFPLSVWADGYCDLSLSLGNFTASVQDVTQVLPHTLTLSHDENSSNCRNYRLYFAKGQANSYQRQAYHNGNALPYNLYRTVSLGNILKDFGDAGVNEFLTVSAPNDDVNYTATWFVEVKSKNTLFSVPPGTYTDTLPVNVYNVRSNGNIDYQGSRWMTLSFVVPRYAEVSVVPVNQPHDPASTVYIMDFGDMVPQEELQADLRIKANVPYGMTVSSLNGGYLRKSPNTTQVPYQIQIGSSGWFTPPTWSYWLGQEFSGSPQAGRRYNIKVRLGNFTNLDDGDYEETITITVSAY